MATKKSNYSGYAGRTKSQKQNSAAYALDVNYEGMRSAYETYKKPSEPSSEKTASQMRKGSESAAERVQRTGRESDNERTREDRRTAGNVGRPPQSKKWIEK